jgi:hypothetical protein
MIANPKSIPSDFKTIRGNIVVKNYLISKGVPILSIDGNNYIFSNSTGLRYYLKRAPFYIRMIIKFMNKNREG